jgi:pentatricopeptide repeat protein
MKKVGVNPDVYTYTILIDSFCKADLIEQAQSWFDDMSSVGCFSNVVTYTAQSCIPESEAATSG